ncbi:MAG: hypothetical protein IPI11_09315 [Haliscomenobacter sp.]|nr:hypothetical protein [Haliscomenobacter sp.]
MYAYSCGQPWLTNALANEIVARILKNDYTRAITAEMVDIAKERLIEQRQTHLDSLTDKSITRILNSSFSDGINQDLAQTSWYLRPRRRPGYGQTAERLCGVLPQAFRILAGALSV